MQLTLICSCGSEFTQDGGEEWSVDGLASCGCGASYAYSATLLAPPDAGSADEADPSENQTRERGAIDTDER